MSTLKFDELENEIATGKLRKRSAIPRECTWDLTRFYPIVDAWEASYKQIKGELETLAGYEGRLCVSGALLAEYLSKRSAVAANLEQLQVYAALSHDSDTRDPKCLERLERANILDSESDSATAFDEPEILAAGSEKIFGLITNTPALGEFSFYLRELFRLSPHIRSVEVEEVLALAGDLTQSPEAIYQKLNDTDLSFDQFDRRGAAQQISQGNIEVYLVDADRDIRRTAYQNYSGSYHKFENTFAACLSAEVKKSIFVARARHYSSTLDAALKEIDLPERVFHNTIDTVRANFPVWHRYWRARAKVLGQKKLAPFDIHAPLSPRPPKVSYAQAVRYLVEGMQPLGEEYCKPLEQGLTSDRWVDVFPNIDKRSNAYCSGAYSVGPYVMMNYGGTLSEMSTLAHELGHAMHSYFSGKNQNYINSNYTLFVAEVASNFNQAMVRARLLESGDRDFKLAVLDEAFYNFHRYLFTMPILARFEYEVHSKAERGEGLTAEYLKSLMCSLLQEGYGSELEIDPHAAGMMWAQFGHLYAPFYVFQYTTGISAANALASAVLNNEPGAKERYLGMLKAGGSKASLDILREAGVDMGSPEPINRAFAVLNGLIDRLEALSLS